MRQLVLSTSLCLLTLPAFATDETVSLPITPSHKRLVVTLWEGDISVASGPERNVLIVSDCETREPEVVDRDGRFRSLRSTSLLPDIVAGDEVIAIRTYEDGPQCTVTLTVPEQLDLHARINFAGSINVDTWRGTLLAWSASGDVSVTDYSGSLSVTAMNGDATVSLASSGIDSDSAITAANGTLTLEVMPNKVPALRVQARWGDIQTNLDTTFEEVIDAGGTWFATKRADADPVLTLRNINRDIVIRNSRP